VDWLICAGPGPGTLASGKLLSTQYQPPSPNRAVDGGKVYSAALRKMASDLQLQRTVATKGREIELAVQNLEEEMVASQQQLSQLEDSLANRYLDLEGSAAHISVSEYEALFEQLEAERRELSDEKLKLQVSAGLYHHVIVTYDWGGVTRQCEKTLSPLPPFWVVV
jgi:hypothetical protein